jgi:hypothetical protein
MASGTARRLTPADLGVAASELAQLDGSFSVSHGSAIVSIAMIEGSIKNPFRVIESLKNLARSEGATMLAIEATLANPRLYDVLAKRYVVQSIGAVDRIDIPL